MLSVPTLKFVTVHINQVVEFLDYQMQITDTQLRGAKGRLRYESRKSSVLTKPIHFCLSFSIKTVVATVLGLRVGVKCSCATYKSLETMYVPKTPFP